MVGMAVSRPSWEGILPAWTADRPPPDLYLPAGFTLILYEHRPGRGRAPDPAQPVPGPGRLVEKDTKTHAARRLALSEDSVALLEEHRRHCAERAEACGVRLSDDAYVFSFDPAGRQPIHPDSVTHGFSRLARRLGLRTRLHDLRHYAATRH
jgi:integrase